MSEGQGHSATTKITITMSQNTGFRVFLCIQQHNLPWGSVLHELGAGTAHHFPMVSPRGCTGWEGDIWDAGANSLAVVEGMYI